MSDPLYIWAAVAPDDSIIAAPFDTEQQVRDWAAMSLDEKYRPYRPVKFVPERTADAATAHQKVDCLACDRPHLGLSHSRYCKADVTAGSP